MNLYCKIVIITLVLLLNSNKLFSQSTYFTYLNDFGALKKLEIKIEDKLLCDSNMSSSEKINIVMTDVKNSAFESYIRLRNVNNIEGNNYTVYDTSGKRKKINNPYWGYVWNYQDQQNYYAVSFKGFNTDEHNVYDQRLLQIDVFRMVNGVKHILRTQKLSDGVDIYDGFNVVKIVYDVNATSVFIGNKELKCIYETNDAEYVDTMGVGYLMGPGSALNIERLVLKKSMIKEKLLLTDWNTPEIDKYLSNSTDFVEGTWKYLDRNIDETQIKLGGKYTIAIVRNNEGDYDILYYAGAVVNSTKWKGGMLKGRLKRTKFQNNYDLVWYDSMMQEMNDDTYAVIDESSVLTLYFPVEKSQIRFVKQ